MHILHEQNIVLEADKSIFDFCKNLQLKQFFFYWLDFCSINDQSIENNKAIIALFWPKYLLLFFFSQKSKEWIYYLANKKLKKMLHKSDNENIFVITEALQ